MAERVWTYYDEPAVRERDIVGYDVEASDGSLGSIDQASYDSDAAYIVVDTSSWKNLGMGQLSVLPAGVIEQVDHDDEKVHLSVSKDAIKDAPVFERGSHLEGRLDPGYRERLETYYEPHTAPVGQPRR